MEKTFESNLSIFKLDISYTLLAFFKKSNFFGVSSIGWRFLTIRKILPQILFFIVLSYFGRNDTKAETRVLWPPHEKSWLIGKNSDARRDWGQEEKGTTEDEMAGLHHGLDGREFEWTPGVGDGQEGLACCDSWGHKESDQTERLNWTELNWSYLLAAKVHWKDSNYFSWHL